MRTEMRTNDVQEKEEDQLCFVFQDSFSCDSPFGYGFMDFYDSSISPSANFGSRMQSPDHATNDLLFLDCHPFQTLEIQNTTLEDTCEALLQERSYTEDQENVRRSDQYKQKIVSHPLFPQLVAELIEFRKIGAPEERMKELEVERSKLLSLRDTNKIMSEPDSDLDSFMNDFLIQLSESKTEIQKVFDDAKKFCSEFEHGISKGMISFRGEETADEDEFADVDPTAEEKELKEQLKRKYRAYLSGLKQEFLKKRKKGKLPLEATGVLREWWFSHLKWPYPSDAEKSRLAELTKLDPKQINNWFINQRKRHWHDNSGR